MRQPALSAFLQEKLQRERKAESDKLAFSASLSRTDMSASVDICPAVQTSPFRAPEPVAGRPRSSAGTEPYKKKGLGLKEMEQVCVPHHAHRTALPTSTHVGRLQPTQAEL